MGTGTLPKFLPQSVVRVKQDTRNRMLVPGETLEIIGVYEGVRSPFKYLPPGVIYLAFDDSDSVAFPHEDDLEPLA